MRRLPPGTKLPGDLDLSVSQDEAFSPDRLRGNVERLYMTVIVGLAALVKHLARLRSWEDSRRTMLFALAYFGAWGVDLLGPLVWGTLLCLIVLPRSRGFLFPPAAALANVDAKTGAVKPVAAHGHGLAMSGDSLTGAREAQKGEAVEQEAHNFVSAFGGIAISSAAGKQHTSAEGGTDGDGEGKKKAAPDPTSAAIKAIDAKDSAEGGATGTKAATKKPVEEAMWEKARPVMQGVGVVADIWEQIGNMLSPTPPFSRKLRWRLGGIAGGLGLVSLIVTPYMVMKGLSFAIGFGFFGDPVIQRGLTYLNTNYPNWKESLDLRNTLLKTVPTNAQLTLTLLRIGEAHHAPLPPPPQTATTAAPPPTPPAEETPGTIEHDKKEKEQQVTDEKPSKSKLPARALAALKNTTKTAVKTTLHTDHLKAKVVGSEAAKNRLGAVPDKKPSADEQGPKTFAARYQGEKGTAVILEPQNAHILEGDPKGVEAIRAAGPVLKWTRDKGGKHGEEEGFVIPIEDIVEVEKLGGLGWKGKVIVGWSLDRQVVDAVRLVYKVGDAGLTDEKVLTAVVGREEVVNRLIAMGSQRWVCC